MIKAALGGGGKGIRIVHKEDELKMLTLLQNQKLKLILAWYNIYWKVYWKS